MMDISQVLKSSTAGTNTNTSSTQTAEQKAALATAKLSPASQAVTKAGNRIQSQLDTTTTQLSTYGKLISAVSDAQLAANNVGKLSATSSATDVKTALDKLVRTFNTAVTAGENTTNTPETGNAKRLNILGGFQASSSFTVRNQAVYKTLIDGNLANPGLRLFVSAGANNMTVDGLAITRGRGLGTNYTNGYGNGGGIYVQWFGTGTLTISHVELYANQSNALAYNSQMGGGLWVNTQSTGPVRLEDSAIYNNKAGKGAGIGWSGRGTILRNRIEGNEIYGDHGGGLYLTMNSGLVEENLIKDNTSGRICGWGWGGGGIVLGSSTVLKNNVWTENNAKSIG